MEQGCDEISDILWKRSGTRCGVLPSVPVVLRADCEPTELLAQELASINWFAIRLRIKWLEYLRLGGLWIVEEGLLAFSRGRRERDIIIFMNVSLVKRI